MPKTTCLRSVSEIQDELNAAELALVQERCKPDCSFYLIDEFKQRMYRLRDELQLAYFRENERPREFYVLLR